MAFPAAEVAPEPKFHPASSGLPLTAPTSSCPFLLAVRDSEPRPLHAKQRAHLGVSPSRLCPPVPGLTVPFAAHASASTHQPALFLLPASLILGPSQNRTVDAGGPFSAMLHYTPPQLSDMPSSTLSPFAKVKRFSTSQEKHPMPPTEDGESVPNPKRSSRLNEFMSRSRTASLPPRPHTSNGPTSRQKLSARLGGFKGKGKDKADLSSPDGDGGGDGEYVIAAASSSMTSGKHSFSTLNSVHFISPNPICFELLACAPVRHYAISAGALPPAAAGL